MGLCYLGLMEMLEKVAPDFAAMLHSAKPSNRMAALARACMEAGRRTGLLGALEYRVLQEAEGGSPPNLEELRSFCDRASVADEKYLGLQHNNAPEADYRPYFNEACLLTAISKLGYGENYHQMARGFYELTCMFAE